MKVLIVGAGAVGQVYARHLSQGGAEVAFFVKEKHRKEVSAAAEGEGLLLHRLPQEKASPFPLRSFSTVSTKEEVSSSSWDYILLCISFSSLQDPSLVPLLLSSCPRSSLFVSLGASLEDQNYLLHEAKVPKERLLLGFVTFSSWPAPLKGERFPALRPSPSSATSSHLAYVTPMPLFFSGPSRDVAPLARALTRGGLWSLRLPWFVYSHLFLLSNFLLPLIVGLEAAGWSFRGLGMNLPLVFLVAGAQQEALRVTAAQISSPLPVRLLLSFRLPFALLLPPLLCAALLLAPLLSPFDLDAFFRYHFSKVGEQTKCHVLALVREGRQRGARMRKLSALSLRVPRFAVRDENKAQKAKEEPKKVTEEPKKEQPKKEQPKDEPKQEKIQQEPKQEEIKKEEVKKEEVKKEEVKKEEVKKEAKTETAKPIEEPKQPEKEQAAEPKEQPEGPKKEEPEKKKAKEAEKEAAKEEEHEEEPQQEKEKEKEVKREPEPQKGSKKKKKSHKGR